MVAIAAQPIADAPPFVRSRFGGPVHTIQVMQQMCVGPRGERSMLLHSLRNYIVRELQPKDYLSEILAVRNFASEHIRYSNDPLTEEQVQDPERITEQIIKFGKAAGDCDDLALWIAAISRQLGREAQFVTVGFEAPGRYSHVFTRVKEPKSGQWIVCDPVAGSNEAAMLRRVKTFHVWDIR